MTEEMTINVILTKQDIKQYFFASNKNRLIFTGVLYLLITILLMVPLIRNTDTILWAVLFFYIMLVLCSAVIAFITFLRYRSLMSEFENNRNYERRLVYKFNAKDYSVRTHNGFLTTNWQDVARIIEIKPCYIIVRSTSKLNIIPKRCFHGAGELNEFIELIKVNVENKKLKLKNYVFYRFSPDSLNFDTAKQEKEEGNQDTASGEAPIFEFSFTLTKNEIVKYNYLFYYTRPSGCVLTLLGLLLLIPVIQSFSGSLEMFMMTRIMITFVCAYMLLLAPVLIYVMAVRNYKMDTSIQNGVSYRFFNDHMIAYNAKGVYKKHFADFCKLIKVGPFYMLFITKRLAYAIPERSIEDKAAFNDFFSYIKKENNRMNSYAMMNQAPVVQESSRFCTHCGAARTSAVHFYCPCCGTGYINR